MIKMEPKRVGKISIAFNLGAFAALVVAKQYGEDVFTLSVWWGFLHYVCSVLNYNLYADMFKDNKKILSREME